MNLAGPGIYLHVPFCTSKCSYCSFFSIVADSKLIDEYFQCLLDQIDHLRNTAPWNRLDYTTIFLGGGTPSTLPTEMLIRLLKALACEFRLSLEEMEISIEVNPATINEQQLQILRKNGFNRLSIGAQSFNDQELKQIGRRHSSEDIIQTYSAALAAGFTNISLDLMYGLPGQTPEKWGDNVRQAMSLQPQHLSLYELTLEPETPMENMVHQGKLDMLPEDIVLEMMQSTNEILSSTAMRRYEISNYSLPGYQCRHNLNYWQNGSYLGLGPGAVAAHKGTRYTIDEDILLYCKKDQKRFIWREEEQLDREALFRETVIMGLRLIEGVNIRYLHDRFHLDPAEYYGATLRFLVDQGLLEYSADSLRLSTKGLPVANSVMAQLV